MHNHDEYPARPGFKPRTSRLQAPVDTNEPSGPAVCTKRPSRAHSKRETLTKVALMLDQRGRHQH